MKDKPVREKKDLDKGLKRSVGKPACCVSKGGSSSNTTSLPNQYIEQDREFSQLKRYPRSDVDSESGSRIKRIDVPGDGSCLFWSVTMAYLIPVRNDDALFRQRYEVLFGNEGAVIQNLDRIRNLVRNLGAANYDDTFANLVRNVFRNRVVDHVSSHRNEFRGFIEGNFESYLENMRNPNAWGGEPEIRAMSGMLRATISVSGATESRYENGNIQIQLFHVGAPGNRNHYNFGLERNIISNNKELAKGLKKVMGKGRPQDFELIQLLIEEAGTEIETSKQEADFRSFEPRFQSFVDQIPSYLHSVEKAGFFTHFFLGSFSTLLDTEIAEKLNIKKIYFSFDTSKTLKVAIVKNGQIGNAEDAINNIDLFSISEGKRGHQFTVNELESILRNNIDRSKIRDRNVEQNIKNEIQDRIKSRLVQIYKGKDGIFVNMEVKEILDSAISKEFHEIEKGIWNNPEGDIEKLANSDKERNDIVQFLEKLNEKKEKPAQRKRRHHHGDHDRHRSHLSRNLLAIDSSNQPEITASSGTRPSSWINDLFSWVKSSMSGLLGSRAALTETSANYSNTAGNQYTSQFNSGICISNNVGLGFFLLQSFLDKKYPLPNLCSVTPEEALADTLNIVGEFEKTLEKTAKQSGVSVKGFDFFKVYLDIAGHVRNERYSQIPNTLYSIAKEACPKNEKFLSIFKGNIEKMFNEQQIVNNGYQPNYVADSKPRSYLSNTTVDKHLQRSYHAISS